MSKFSLLDCDQSENDLNGICDFLHGDQMDSPNVLEQYLGEKVTELANDLISSHFNILRLKDMIVERDIEITELKEQVADCGKKNEQMDTKGQDGNGNEKAIVESIDNGAETDQIEIPTETTND